jgi:Zn-finger nucleic acid-binding protein
MSSFTCPVDGATLVPVERQGIEIDHCPTCRGVWLDRGELDKLIERSAAPAQAAPPPAQQQFDDPYRERRHYDDHRRYPQHKRRKSFLEELFD